MLPAIGTVAIDFVFVKRHFKTKVPHNRGLDSFQLWTIEFDNLVAGKTNQMIVMGDVYIVFRISVRELSFYRNPCLHQQFQRAIDRGWIDDPSLPPKMLMQLFNSVMSVQ